MTGLVSTFLPQRQPTENTLYKPYSNNSLDSAVQGFQQAGNMAQQAASPQSLDRSLARIRSRVDTSTRANETSLRDQYAGRGRLDSGAAQSAMNRNRIGGLNALSSGYAQAYDDYNTRLLNASGAMSTAATGMGTIGQTQAKTALDEQQMNVNRQNAATQQYTAENDAVRAEKERLASILQNYASFGNSFSNPGLLNMILMGLGIDVTGLGFAKPEYGTTPEAADKTKTTVTKPPLGSIPPIGSY